MTKATKEFKIICLDTKNVYSDIGTDGPTIFQDGSKAEAFALRLSQVTGQKWQVRLHVVDDRWKERETKRFYDGTYHPVPWDSQDWYRSSPYWHSHFAHISVEKDVRIAYTPNEDMGIADRQNRVRPGAYLTQYFARAIGADEIRRWVAEFSIEHEDIQLKFAKTADQIEDVYRHGPQSCMDGRQSSLAHFKSPFHPVRAYAGPDLAIAYLDKQGTDDEITGKQGLLSQVMAREEIVGSKYSARCVVWPEKKLYGKIYGDTDRLRLVLKKSGFRHALMEGARLVKHQCEFIDAYNRKQKGFVAPFIDDVKRVREDGNHLVLDQKGYMETSQAGVVCDNRPRCVECQQLNHNFRYVRPRDIGAPQQALCEPCFNRVNPIQCRETGDYVRREHILNVPGVPLVHLHYVERYIALCSMTNQYITLKGTYADYARLADGSFVSMAWLTENTAKYIDCTHCGRKFPKDGDFRCSSNGTRCYSKIEWVAVSSGVYHRSELAMKTHKDHTFVTYDEANKTAEAFYNKEQEERLAKRKCTNQEQIAANRSAGQRRRRERERMHKELRA